MGTAKVSAKGWVVIPKPLRDRYGIEPGSMVKFVDYGGVLIVVPQRSDAIEANRGILRRPGEESLTEAYLKEKREEKEREERRIERYLRP